MSRVCAAIIAAKEVITANFAISEGWKRVKPRLIQRVAPPTSMPISGTRASIATATKRISSDSF